MTATTHLKFLFILFFSSKIQANFYYDVAVFCKNNGLNYLTISSLPHLSNITNRMVREINQQFLPFRQLSFDQVYEHYELYQDSLLLMAESDLLNDEESLQPYLSIITISKIKRGILVFTTPFSREHEKLLDKMVNFITENALFYVLYQEIDTYKTKYKQAITVRTASFGVTNPIELNQFGHVIENYDLKGLKIWSNTLSWAPFFTIENCDEEGQNCDHYGFYHDHMEAMGKLTNFSFESHTDPDNNWGVRPISGPFNKSGIWGGSMGEVINGNYMISISQWVWNIDRYGLVDFISTSSDTYFLVLTPKQPEVDYFLFIRCFTNDAWKGCIVVLIIAISILIIPYGFIDYFEQTVSYGCAKTSFWIFFVLLNAFYCGALTMFFSSEISIPFISIEDVIREYPYWKLKMLNGNDVHFQYKAIQGNSLYADFWDRVQNKPEETVFDSIEEGLGLLLQEQAVIHCSSGMLKGYFKANPFHQQDVKTFARQKGSYYALIIPINSPLKPILQKASNTLLEAGTMDYLMKLWIGQDLPNVGEVDTTVLSGGQVILSFLVMFGVYIASGFVFLGELAYKRVKNKFKVNAFDKNSNGKYGLKKGIKEKKKKISDTVFIVLPDTWFQSKKQQQQKSNASL